jgi:hypothetical protein
MEEQLLSPNLLVDTQGNRRGRFKAQGRRVGPAVQEVVDIYLLALALRYQGRLIRPREDREWPSNRAQVVFVLPSKAAAKIYRIIQF